MIDGEVTEVREEQVVHEIFVAQGPSIAGSQKLCGRIRVNLLGLFSVVFVGLYCDGLCFLSPCEIGGVALSVCSHSSELAVVVFWAVNALLGRFSYSSKVLDLLSVFLDRLQGFLLACVENLDGSLMYIGVCILLLQSRMPVQRKSQNSRLKIASVCMTRSCSCLLDGSVDSIVAYLVCLCRVN